MKLLGEVGCYVLDLYCNHCELEAEGYRRRTQFTGQTLSECRKAARKAGWITGRKQVLCPQHKTKLTTLIETLST